MEYNSNGKGNGQGGDFRVEQNGRRAPASDGAAASLGRYGSLAECIECVIAAGAYVSFGRTSDGGATLIRVLDGNDKLTSYCHTHAQLLEAMEALQLRYKRGLYPIAADPPKAPVKGT